ncbi:rod shape-determining protein MreC [Streptococcus phocae subsp. salmonis]|nr:hypothetical protein NX86_04950 [Streptococcus phocae subsp. salmonis]
MHRVKLYRFFLMLTIASLFFSLIFMVYRTSVSPYVASMLRSPMTQFDSFVSRPLFAIKESISEGHALISTFSDNKTLQKELKIYKAKAFREKNLQAKNDELRQLLHLSSTQWEAAKPIFGKIISRNPYSWSQTVIIDTNATSLKKKSLVTSEAGLLGQVTSTSKSSAHVELLTSGKEIDLPVKMLSDKTIIYGNLKQFQVDSQTMVISEFNSNNPVSLGTKVYTSGLDSETVADIPIGKVVGFVDSPDRLKRQILISLFADFNHINYVLVAEKGES